MPMDPRLTARQAGPTFFVFGSLSLSFDTTTFTTLRSTVHQNPKLSWAASALSGLASQWRAAAAHTTSPGDTDLGVRQLQQVFDAFSSQYQHVLDLPFPLPNKVLVPLVVLYQLQQHVALLESRSVEHDSRADIFATHDRNIETLGFCTGLLGAFVASSATSEAQFAEYGAAALRLGMLVGAVADLGFTHDGDVPEPARCIGTECSTEAKTAALARILDNHPESYVSVRYDHNRATLTTPLSAVPALKAELRAAGIVASEIGLRGRYHSPAHQVTVDALKTFCDAHVEFQLPEAASVARPTRSSVDGRHITAGSLHHHVLDAILLEQPTWHQALGAIRDTVVADANALVISLGQERCLPPSLAPALGPQTVHLADHLPLTEKSLPRAASHQLRQRGVYPDTDIAVVGMACKVAGADSVDEFWDVLASGQSQHREIRMDGSDRFSFATQFRRVDPCRKWFANFARDPDMFDHKFFKTSPREAATTDPQQRLLLQVAYQSVEQSGYFQKSKPHPTTEDSNIGVYIAHCGTDYENNVASHPANAFAATGNLEGFNAGKISHFFGWTGPGMVIDTACSGSAVSIDMACRALLSGQCRAALAGGTSVMTSPYRFQNLAGASFLSTTGQCKPFDRRGDGYCRGDGVATVFLKKLSTALRDGDQVLGVIAATAVRQNQNCTPIFVPNAPSLSDLFRSVTATARIDPADISVVEAHGTGTAVGDPAEYASVKQVLVTAQRAAPLHLGSAKGFIGHTEPTSGIMSLIKVLLMMQKGVIPAQASFQSLNTNIDASDNIIIPTSSRPWDAPFKAALINNYGASGSNASMVVAQPPARIEPAAPSVAGVAQYPFWLCGRDAGSVRRNAGALAAYVKRHTTALVSQPDVVANFSFNLANQSNRSLAQSVIFTAKSLHELERNLNTFAKDDGAVAAAQPASSKKPVVLCFGGQVSTFIGLDKEIYDGASILRKHLDTVDYLAQSLGGTSIYPGIFQREPVKDTVKLQVMLFAMQYASARSWIDCGVQPTALIGHSFGELTALSIAQVLSLEDTLRAIIHRATLIRDVWGEEKGAMMAVEADLPVLRDILDAAGEESTKDNVAPASIACYNGPRSFTVAGASKAIDAVANIISQLEKGKVKSKRLNVTNSFHCSLTDPLLESLVEFGKGLTFREPKIPLEHATAGKLLKVNSDFFANHMRSPVFFDHALKRITRENPECIFLEAGTNSTITVMASRTLGSPAGSHFQAMNVAGENGCNWNRLVDSTISLWNAGLSVNFWGHHGEQAKYQTPLNLPPYQFERNSHWLELKTPDQALAVVKVVEAAPQEEKLPDTLTTFEEYRDAAKLKARFRVNTATPKYLELVAGHTFANTAAICPVTVQLDMIIESLLSLHPEFKRLSREPQLLDIVCGAPVTVDNSRGLWIEFEDVSATSRDPTFRFRLFSTAGTASTDNGTSVATSGTIVLHSTSDNSIALEFGRLGRLVSAAQCKELLSGEGIQESLRCPSIYKLFSHVVDYRDEYRGIQKIVSTETMSAGQVTEKVKMDTWFDAFMSDYFCQVVGVWASCLSDCPANEMYVCNGMGQWFRNPALAQSRRAKTLNVLAHHQKPTSKTVVSDIYVFDPETEQLVEVVSGISFVRVTGSSMARLLVRLTPSLSGASKKTVAAAPYKLAVAAPAPQAVTAPAPPKPTEKRRTKKAPSVNVEQRLKTLIAELSGVDVDDIRPDSMLADLGIDSLLGMELAQEVDSVFKIHVPEDMLVEMIDMPRLIKGVAGLVGAADDEDIDDPEEAPAPPTITAAPVQVPAQVITQVVEQPRKVTSSVDVEGRLKALIAELSGVEVDEIRHDSMLADLGIDSLLGMELAQEVDSAFGIHVPEDMLVEMIDMPRLVKGVASLVGSVLGDDSSSDEQSSSESCSGVDTPATVLDQDGAEEKR